MADGRKTSWTDERKAAHREKLKAAWERRKAEAEATGKRLRKPMSAEGRKNVSRSWTKERRERHAAIMSGKWDSDEWREEHEKKITNKRGVKYPPPPFDVTKIEGYDWENPHANDIRNYLTSDQIAALDDWERRCLEAEKRYGRTVY